MIWLRRAAYFIALNIIVALTISTIMSLFGIQPALSSRGLNIPAMFFFYLLWGMGGAFVSLFASKIYAKWALGVRIVDPSVASSDERRLVDMVHRLALAAGLRKMPDVGVYESPEVNAFATGPTRSNSLVAVSSGLLGSMDSRSLEGVLGHEVSHIANGDMVTMTLLQGVVNAFVYMLANLVALAIDNALRGDRDERGGGLGYMGRWLVTMALEMILFIPGSMVIAMFSRKREYRADAGGAQLAGRGSMITALRALQRVSALNQESAQSQSQSTPAISALKISGSANSRMSLLFATHPPLEDRIARLESAASAPS